MSKELKCFILKINLLNFNSKIYLQYSNIFFCNRFVANDNVKCEKKQLTQQNVINLKNENQNQTTNLSKVPFFIKLN